MSRSHLLDQQKLTSKLRSKTPTDMDSLDNDSLQKQHHYQYEQQSDNSSLLSRKLALLEEKFQLSESNQKLTDRKLEELAIQFDRFISNGGPSPKLFDGRFKVVEERIDLINSKLDKGLLILQRDIQDLESHTSQQISNALAQFFEPALNDLHEQLRMQQIDLEDFKFNCQAQIKQLQSDFPNPQIHSNRPQQQQQQQQQPPPSFAQENPKNHSFAEGPAQAPPERIRHDTFQNQEYDETRRRIDEGICIILILYHPKKSIGEYKKRTKNEELRYKKKMK